MNAMPDHDPIDELLLRSALRIDASERAPRLDAVAIALRAARRSPLELALATVRVGVLMGFALALGLGAAYAALGLVGELDPTGLLGVAIAAAAWGLTLVAQAAVLLMSPTIGLASLAALLFAIVYESAIRRERVHAEAS
jgi:hypothetical protein